MIPEAMLDQTEHGLVPRGEGWFVVNTREARWRDDGDLGTLCYFEGDVRFPQIGINVSVLQPGQPMCMYHYEVDQEDFLVLGGDALLIVEGQERPLRQWDFVHCPPNTKHVIVGAGDGPAAILAVGARLGSTGADWGAYTVDAAALKHGAGVETETTDSQEAYASHPELGPTRYREGWLP